MLKNLANAVLFQLGWFACVLGGNSLWLLLAGAALLAHLLWIRRTRAEVHLVIAVCVLGTAVDSVLMNTGVFVFKHSGVLIPFWLMLLWALLAITLNHCLAWTAKPLWRALLLGAFGGPLSYYAGQRLGAVQFPLGLWPTLMVLAVLWAVLFAALLWLAKKLEKVSKS
ncbi:MULTISPECIES: DUF2878 domain-containing protein [Pseudomonas]|uniref:DUF2878 domain-containing protein n=1 Tax=Pseudomonas TaxID=286 RepID=UPI00103FFDCF|nr:DUF2878 domain-containing protein [Pseudomonas sp. D1HM]MBW0235514.1 hypothetical protein [Pseudomonas sp. D1HM]